MQFAVEAMCMSEKGSRVWDFGISSRGLTAIYRGCVGAPSVGFLSCEAQLTQKLKVNLHAGPQSCRRLLVLPLPGMPCKRGSKNVMRRLLPEPLREDFNTRIAKQRTAGVFGA